MSAEEIKQNAEEYANSMYDKKYQSELWKECYMIYIAGAHSRDDEIKHLEEQLERTACNMIAYNAQVEQISNPWISVEDGLPKKKDGKIRSDILLVTLGQSWTVAEYHFGDKRWINLLGERETIKPEYWKKVNLPEEVLF